MRRLLWAGVGAAVAVVAAQKVRATARRYTPAGVQEQVSAARRSTGSALQDAVRRFSEARAAREAELTTTLLVQPESGDPGAVLGGRRRTSSWDDDAPAGRHARPSGRVDEDEPLYDF